MRVRRLRLLETEIVEHEAGSSEAVVKLRFQDRNFIGTEGFSKGEEEEKLDAVARATIEAIKQALPLPVDIYLRKVLRLNPQFLNDLLLVSMVDLYIDCRRLSLTGCCVCMNEDVAFGVARATLDSTNRVVDYLLKNFRTRPSTRP
jgi:hypothetical protein